MARFDIYRLAGGGLVVDCQADFLGEIGTRFTIPLMTPNEGPPANARLNPIFDVLGERLVLVTQFAAGIRVSELRSRVGSLDQEHVRVIGALDVLTGTG